MGWKQGKWVPSLQIHDFIVPGLVIQKVRLLNQARPEQAGGPSQAPRSPSTCFSQTPNLSLLGTLESMTREAWPRQVGWFTLSADCLPSSSPKKNTNNRGDETCMTSTFGSEWYLGLRAWVKGRQEGRGTDALLVSVTGEKKKEPLLLKPSWADGTQPRSQRPPSPCKRAHLPTEGGENCPNSMYYPLVYFYFSF